ncbi:MULTISPECIES: SPFH domain-containing protein [unclassified Siphonobacter]|uniref:SPFH domain-containing protein n=1 Tax=unclassified Siphonobacter TaxID=2635712 RepID=UPI000CC3F9FB|nr:MULTISPECIES: SPFH domain-containing protein [unclassified Siphonobacter]MDQ1089486.1 regulator of protease activity HflC (stomatin/prohibitin superfamily) [Siphonobacter sp. SORGH_AS_1065]MDR6195723.1 regulator of protease activity HflC (stomatin/prohibitin superfamily) [Siphonobacter sp. SORGH_AS_0500]PKK37534.1 band 7 protein [Siphonobacter sp. SORGH_AS_0500]
MRDKIVHPPSGYLMLALTLLAFPVGIGLFFYSPIVAVVVLLAALIASFGFFIVNPNEAKILVLFGNYAGTVKDSGFKWSNPFYMKSTISLRARNLEGDKIKVNDSLGNPIVIGAVVVWQVNDTAQAKFEVDNYVQYVKLQSDAALRHMAGTYAYDHFDDDQQEITLRSGGDLINEKLESELSERLARAGVTILEARITHLAYAEEIAHAMLQRQQATAMVAARTKIVEGAVGMVDLALKRLTENAIVELDEEKKAAMVSNLLVVLCSDKAANPVVNTGTLYH